MHIEVNTILPLKGVWGSVGTAVGSLAFWELEEASHNGVVIRAPLLGKGLDHAELI